MTDKQSAVIHARENGKEFARVYHAVYGRLPRRNAPYSKEHANWKTDQVVESAAGGHYQELGFEWSINPIYTAYVNAFRSACYNWKPSES